MPSFYCLTFLSFFFLFTGRCWALLFFYLPHPQRPQATIHITFDRRLTVEEMRGAAYYVNSRVLLRDWFPAVLIGECRNLTGRGAIMRCTWHATALRFLTCRWLLVTGVHEGGAEKSPRLVLARSWSKSELAGSLLSSRSRLDRLGTLPTSACLNLNERYVCTQTHVFAFLSRSRTSKLNAETSSKGLPDSIQRRG